MEKNYYNFTKNRYTKGEVRKMFLIIYRHIFEGPTFPNLQVVNDNLENQLINFGFADVFLDSKGLQKELL